MSDTRRTTKLSKFLALLLRHRPERFALALDAEGWASLDEVLDILQGLPNFRWATRADVARLAEEPTPDGKRRFEIDGRRIRARYGHSIPQPIRYAEVEPPLLLYHGTSPQALPAIQEEGLQPMGRQYVHLSPDEATARAVGARHADAPIILIVRAAEAHAAGVPFYRAGDTTYLSAAVPPQFVEFPPP